MDPIVYKLKHPFQFGDSRKVEELVFKRRPTVDDFEDSISARLTPREQMQVMAKVAGEPFAVFKRIDGEDMLGLMEIMTAFLQPGQVTGGEPSVT